MNVEKIRNLGPSELQQSQRDSAEQLFRLKFQMKMGQTTGLKKMRELRKDLARIKTITRERELGISGPAASDVAASPTQAVPAASVAARTATRKSVAKKKSPATTKKAKSAAPKKAVAKKTKKKAGAKK
jgi:large subunit ribosomal protein L29